MRSPRSHARILTAFLLTALMLFATAAHAASTIVRKPISARQGGVIEHPAGATLVIPRRALSHDVLVEIEDLGYDAPPRGIDQAHVSISTRFRIDIGDAKTRRPLELRLALPRRASFPIDPTQLVMMHGDDEGLRHLNKVDAVSMPGFAVIPDIGKQLEEKHDDARTFELVSYRVFEALSKSILDVPYYSQSGLAWCTPTALAMLLGYHATNFPYISNWSIAAIYDLPAATNGSPNYAILREMEIPEEDWDFYYWDDELISVTTGNGRDEPFVPTPFMSWLKYQTHGYNPSEVFGDELVSVEVNGRDYTVHAQDIDIAPRPVQLSADTRNHAFVVVGTSETNVYAHDSSGAFTGSTSISEPIPWDDFLERAFTDTQNDELRTVTMRYEPLSEKNRHGSIELRQGGSANLSFKIPSQGGDFLSVFRWDGLWGNGYYWDDNANVLEDDPFYGNVIPREAEMEIAPGIANVTQKTRRYLLSVQIVEGSDPDGGPLRVDMIFSRQVTAATRQLPGAVAVVPLETSLQKSGLHTLTLRLFENGILQDEKRVRFNYSRGNN